MAKLTVEIIACPIYSYKLRAEGIQDYHEKALEQARDLYLKLYENAYQQLMGNNFNPLWTPDTKAENDLDFKDDFGRVTYFYFNISLLKKLLKLYEIEIVDRTQSKFEDQHFLYSFFEEEGIPFKVPNKSAKRFAKHKVRQFVVEGIRNLPRTASSTVDNLKEKLSTWEEDLNVSPAGKVDYLYLHSFKGMSLKNYLNWRYGEIIPSLEKKGYQIIVLSTIDFDGANSIDYPFFNVNRLVSKSEIRKAFIQSFLYKTRVNFYTAKEWAKSSTGTEERYFLANLPADFFYAFRELTGLDKLFKEIGPGLLLIKGPVNNKGASSLFFTARRNGVRVMVISPRILTSTRFSNQFIKTHFKEGYPDIYPHSIAVDDQVSFETIENQTDQIELYRVRQEKDIVENTNAEVDFKPFRITLVLQKRKEIKEMAEYVIEGLKGLRNVIVQFKEHPSFPIPNNLLDKYKEVDYVQILPSDITLEQTVEKSDLCVTSYSSAALEFVKSGKPVIWLENVTSNSIFFADLYRKLGLRAKSSEELKESIKNLTADPVHYYKERDRQYEQIKKLLFISENEHVHSLSEIVDKEFEKV